MRCSARALLCSLGAAALLVAGCASGQSGRTSPQLTVPSTQTSSVAVTGEVPSPERLAGMLLAAQDLGSAWAPAQGPPGEPSPLGGVVTEEQRGMLPRLDMCADAPSGARAAAEALAWQAFTQLDMNPADPLDFPGGDRVGHMVFAQEFLLADDPGQVRATFDVLQEGLAACLGAMPAGDGDGHSGISQEWAAPPVGDDRYGVLMTVHEPGGGSNGTWLLRNVLVRDGPVLMLLDVVEITVGEGVTPELSPEEVDAVVVTAAARLA